ncbi:TetR/AcrR family transcriptional regulator [Streptomyces mirabilis]|uniref:TetR/AcrR family transcriptional regulator n=1 Tax=Streptomyces sp. NPDC005388 TaxID=3156717 RepID=UPI0033B37111
MPEALLPEDRQSFGDPVQHAFEVDVDHLLPVLDTEVVQGGDQTDTLYRNFPTREALIEAAYRNEVARLCEAVPGFLATMPPREALRAWTRRFIDYATAKLGMAEALRAVVASGTNPYAESHELIQAALTSLMNAGTAAGAIRTDISPTDMFAALAGIALTSAGPDQREQAERLLDLTLDGLRPTPPREPDN